MLMRSAVVFLANAGDLDNLDFDWWREGGREDFINKEQLCRETEHGIDFSDFIL